MEYTPLDKELDHEESITLELSQQDKDDILTALSWYLRDLTETELLLHRVLRVQDLCNRLHRAFT